MSAPCESAASPAPCACTNISLMQLFHELKQKFPGVPDHVVSNTIELYCHDKQACEKHLHSEVKASLTHAYHASSSAAARNLNQIKLNPPLKCRNQPIVKHQAEKPTSIKSSNCAGPQKAILSSVEDKENKVNTDANQNIVEAKNEIIRKSDHSPVTIINLDNCQVKYNAESPSDGELTNENRKENDLTRTAAAIDRDPGQPESTNYRILKSNKIKSNLPERLEKTKEKKTIKKEEPKKDDPADLPTREKPKRPNTLDFVRAEPDVAFKRPPGPAEREQRAARAEPDAWRGERGYGPLNLSVNVNCHMDLGRGFGDPWLEESPRAITSLNLTVCTPTSALPSPERDAAAAGAGGSGFQGQLTLTLSPTAAPRRRAPPPPDRSDEPRPARPAPDPPNTQQHTQSVSDRSLIERQKERLGRLATALAQEKGRLMQLSRETQILAGAPPSPSAAQRLRDYVERLRDQCDTLAKRLEMAATEAEESNNFYSNIYTGQRPPSSWQCHMCTFRNHPLLDKCEECDMPRILVVRARDGITVRLMPGQRKITRSWVL